MKALKCFLGKHLFLKFENHRAYSLDPTKFNGNWGNEYEEYFRFGLSEYKFDILWKNSEYYAYNNDFSKCNNPEEIFQLGRWYKYTYLYKRLYEEIPGNIFQKLKILNHPTFFF